MRSTITLVAVLAFSCCAITMAVANSNFGDGAISILDTSVQDPVDAPVPVESAAQLEESQASVSDQIPEIPSVAESGELDFGNVESVVMDPIVDMQIVDMPIVDMPIVSGGCNTCCATPSCCCPPPATPTVFCLQDPCGCSHQACIDVPACCAGQSPCITWRRGILGRQIATVCWKCCGHQVKVIVTCKGNVRVRG